MKLKGIFASLLLVAAVSAHAQTVVDSTSAASTASTAGANNAGNAQQITFNNAGDQHYSGSYTARTTGQAVVSGFAGSFSSDYCGGTAGIAVGGPGFSVSGGAPKFDDTCRFLRTFERVQQAAASDPANAAELRAAALEILAEVDPKVRIILTRHKLVKGEAMAQIDPSGTVGEQPPSLRVAGK
jgi:hypothetical protein